MTVQYLIVLFAVSINNVTSSYTTIILVLQNRAIVENITQRPHRQEEREIILRSVVFAGDSVEGNALVLPSTVLSALHFDANGARRALGGQGGRGDLSRDAVTTRIVVLLQGNYGFLHSVLVSALQDLRSARALLVAVVVAALLLCFISAALRTVVFIVGGFCIVNGEAVLEI